MKQLQGRPARPSYKSEITHLVHIVNRQAHFNNSLLKLLLEMAKSQPPEIKEKIYESIHEMAELSTELSELNVDIITNTKSAF